MNTHIQNVILSMRGDGLTYAGTMVNTLHLPTISCEGKKYARGDLGQSAGIDWADAGRHDGLGLGSDPGIFA